MHMYLVPSSKIAFNLSMQLCMAKRIKGTINVVTTKWMKILWKNHLEFSWKTICIHHSMRDGCENSQNKNSMKYIKMSVDSGLWWFSNYNTLLRAWEDWELSVKWFRCRSKKMKKTWLCSAFSSHLHMYSMLYQLADLRVKCASALRYSTHTQTYEHICSRVKTDSRKISETSCHLLENIYF